MKKVLSIIISALIIILSLSVTCFATDTVTLSLQDEKVYAGDEFTVNLFISDNAKVSGAVIDINYDKSKLEFVSAKEGAILDSGANISIRNMNKDSSYVRFAYMAMGSSITSEGILFSVTFKVLESANGKTDLKITIPSPADFVSEDLEKIPYTVRNSSITILNEIPSETISETETDSTEAPTEDLQETESQSITNNEGNDNGNKSDDNILGIALALFGVVFICFGVAFTVKKKKK